MTYVVIILISSDKISIGNINRLNCIAHLW